METVTATKSESKNTKTSLLKSGDQSGIASVLNDKSFGLTLRGMVVSMGEERTFEGVDAKSGKSYSRTVRAFDVACGDKVVSVGFNKEEGIPDITFGSIITVNVDYCRAAGGKISVNGKLID